MRAPARRRTGAARRATPPSAASAKRASGPSAKRPKRASARRSSAARQEANFKKASEEEARRRLAGGEPAPAPAAPQPRKTPVVAQAPVAASAASARRPAEAGAPRPQSRRSAALPQLATAKPMLPTPRPARGAEPRQRGRLTVTTATSAEDERTRSVAAFRRRTQRLKGHGQSANKEKIAREIVLPEMITIQELANRMSERAVDVIKLLMRQGRMVTLTDSLDADTAQIIAEDMGHTVKRVSESDVEEGLFENPEDVGEPVARPPVVTIMGHVDHGKTSLLDAIRNANVVEGEAGGITQHIGAYQVTAPGGEKVTFIDTPGHAAFTAMRARGAKVTDIVVLVVAADDGVMPQTIEAIKHAKAANAPIIVAINKIDKPDANPSRVIAGTAAIRRAGRGVRRRDALPCRSPRSSARTSTSCSRRSRCRPNCSTSPPIPNRNAEGTVIEARLDRGRGPVATVLVQRGTLQGRHHRRRRLRLGPRARSAQRQGRERRRGDALDAGGGAGLFRRA